MTRDLHEALVAIFGAQPQDIAVSQIDQLCATLTGHTTELLLRAAGGDWAAILDRIAEKRSAAKAAKDPGADPRFIDREKAPSA